MKDKINLIDFKKCYKLTNLQLRLFLEIYNRTEIIYSSNNYFAQKLNIHSRTVQKILAKLERLNLIIRFASESGCRVRYIFCLFDCSKQEISNFLINA